MRLLEIIKLPRDFDSGYAIFQKPCFLHWIGAYSGGTGDSLGVGGDGRRLLSIAIRVSFSLGNGQAWEAAPGEGRLTPCRVGATGNRGGIVEKRACDKTVPRCSGK